MQRCFYMAERADEQGRGYRSECERCEILADYIIRNKCTVRRAASHFEISKSTIHKDITKKLKNVNYGKYTEGREIIDVNKAERHLRGGMATKRKYERMKMKK